MAAMFTPSPMELIIVLGMIGLMAIFIVVIQYATSIGTRRCDRSGQVARNWCCYNDVTHTRIDIDYNVRKWNHSIYF